MTDREQRQLEFYEAEVRRLEQAVVQQKQNYLKELQALQPEHVQSLETRLRELEAKCSQLSQLEADNERCKQELQALQQKDAEHTRVQQLLQNHVFGGSYKLKLSSLETEDKQAYLAFLATNSITINSVQLNEMPVTLAQDLSYQQAQLKSQELSFQGATYTTSHPSKTEVRQSLQSLGQEVAWLNPILSQLSMLLDPQNTQEMHQEMQTQMEQDIQEKDQQLLEQEQQLLSMTEMIDECRSLIQSTKNELAAVESSNEQLHQQVQQITKQLNDSVTVIHTKDQQITKLNLELGHSTDAMAKQQVQFSRDLDQLRSQLIQQQETIELVTSHSQSLEQHNHQLQTQITTLQSDLSHQQSQSQLKLDQTQSHVEQLTSKHNQQLQDIYDQLQESQQMRGQQQQRINQLDADCMQLKQDIQVLLKYRTDLEELLEQSTNSIEMKNRKIQQFDEKIKAKDQQLSVQEQQYVRVQQMADNQRKQVVMTEVKLKQLMNVTVKDLKHSLKERQAEVEVLKEMVKSANGECKAKEIDIQRLKGRLARGDNDYTSRPRQTSASPARMNVIQETDPLLEATGKDHYELPKMNKSRKQEWEEAVELDRMLEQERRESSLKRMQMQTEQKYNEYMERSRKGQSSGIAGLLGSSTGKVQTSSLPDLLQNKRDMYQRELNTPTLKKRH